jgi:sphingosine kinase
VNPFGGRKLAQQIWRTKAKPVFDAAGVPYELQLTTHAGHAAELAFSLDFGKYAGFVTCSGDGLLWEALQGIMQRKDWHRVLASTSFGIIPAGSGNGLAASIGTLDPAVAAATICMGVARPMDLAAVRQYAADGSFRVWWSILMLTWGLIADVDIGSENLRARGGARFTVAGVQRVAKLHAYAGRIAFLPAADGDAKARAPRCDGPLGACKHCDTAVRVAEHAAQVDEFVSADDADDDDDAAAAAPHAPSFDPKAVKLGSARGAAADVVSRVPRDFSFDNPPAGWQVLPQQRFLMLLVANHTHISYDTYVAPNAHISDGKLDVVAIPGGCTRGDALKVLLNMDSGSAFTTSPASIYAKALAVVVEPSDVADAGIMDADGEQIPAVRTAVEVYRSMFSFFCKQHTVRDAGN